MLIWIFGDVKSLEITANSDTHTAGHLELKRANVRWFLSINYQDIPEEVRESGKRTYRNLSLGDEELEFSEGFADLHTLSYKEILNGRGSTLSDARPSLELTYKIRELAYRRQI